MLEILADLGEFIGGVAVLVTIIYFAVQLRANLNANRAQALSSWTMAASVEKEALYKDPAFTKLYREVVLEGRAPEGDEVVQLYSWYTQYMNTWQLAYMQYRSGVMDSEFLEPISSGYALYLRSEHILIWWKELGSAQYDRSFVEYVNEKLNEAT